MLTMSEAAQSYLPFQNLDIHRHASEKDVSAPFTPEFEKIKSAFGFVEPPHAASILTDKHSLSNEKFDDMMRTYIDEYCKNQAPIFHETSDVYPFRGILVSVAQLYYEHQHLNDRHSSADRSRNYQYKEYLRTIDEDMRYLNEPPNEHLDKLLHEFGIVLPNFPKPNIVRFSTNIMVVLAKIDRNLTKLPLNK